MTPRLTTRIASLAALCAAGAIIVPATAEAQAPVRAHATHECTNANLHVDSADRSAAEAAVVCLVNQQRTAHGLPALKVSTKLNRSAQGWSNRMVAANTFTHGSDFSGRIAATGFRWNAAGENIAAGFTTPFGVVKAWMGDVGHCQNILRPMFNYVGTGLDASGNGSGDLADTWTQDFGLLAGTRTGTSNMKPAAGCPYKLSESSTVTAPSPTLVKPAGDPAGAAAAASVSSTQAASDGGPEISW
jgi:uncharacterized protein YkwD